METINLPQRETQSVGDNVSGKSRHFKDFKRLHKQSSMAIAVERQRITKTNGNEVSSALRTLQEVLHLPDPDSPLPFLETWLMVAKKYPYAALGAMISIASVIICAVTILAVSIMGAMFLMYGQMREVSAKQITILEKQQAIETRQLDDGKVMRAYEAANGKRIEFIVGLMSRDQQQRANEYDRAHPVPLMPEKPRNDKE